LMQGLTIVGSLAFGATALTSGVSLWGGRKVLQQQFQKDGSLRNDLTECQKTGLKVAGYALMAIGVVAGILACGLLSFGLIPISVLTAIPTATFLAVKITAFVSFAISTGIFAFCVYRKGVPIAAVVKKEDATKGSTQKIEVTSAKATDVKATEISSEKSYVSDVIFSNVNQYQKGGRAACTLASVSFAASLQDEYAHAAMQDALDVLGRDETVAFSNSKKESNKDGTFGDLPFDLDDAKDRNMLTKLGLTKREMKVTNVSGITMGNRVSYGSDRVLAQEDLLKGFKEWNASKATGTLFICAGAALAVRKKDSIFELFEPHGETWALQNIVKTSLKGLNTAYVVSFSEIESAVKYIWTLHGKTIDTGSQTQFDLGWYQG
jgi:hypothetical protein